MKRLSIVIVIAVITSIIVITVGWKLVNDHVNGKTFVDQNNNTVVLQDIPFDKIKVAEPQKSEDTALQIDVTSQNTVAGSQCRTLSIPVCDRYTQSAIVTSVSQDGCVEQISCVPMIEATTPCDYSGEEYKTESCRVDQVGVTVVGSNGCFMPNFCVVGTYQSNK